MKVEAFPGVQLTVTIKPIQSKQQVALSAFFLIKVILSRHVLTFCVCACDCRLFPWHEAVSQTCMCAPFTVWVGSSRAWHSAASYTLSDNAKCSSALTHGAAGAARFPFLFYYSVQHNRHFVIAKFCLIAMHYITLYSALSHRGNAVCWRPGGQQWGWQDATLCSMLGIRFSAMML